MARHAVAGTLLAFGLASVSSSLDWPGNSPIGIEFGGPNAGFPLPGLVISGTGIDIRTAGAGEVSFERSALDDHTSLPSALGDTLVIEGDDGMASIYAYLPGIADPGARSLVAGALIGKSGSAGLLDTNGFMFALYDRKSGRWVNPRVFLPKLEDAKAPVIRKVSLEAKGKTLVLGDSKSIPQGFYSIVVDAAELEAGMPVPAVGPPWYLRVLKNGEKVVELQTEIATVKNGALSFYPGYKDGPVEVDGSGSVRIAPRAFTRGKVSVEVLVRDFAGNERSAGWTILVE